MKTTFDDFLANQNDIQVGHMAAALVRMRSEDRRTFAIEAWKIMLHHPNAHEQSQLAQTAVRLADELIAELNKEAEVLPVIKKPGI